MEHYNRPQFPSYTWPGAPRPPSQIGAPHMHGHPHFFPGPPQYHRFPPGPSAPHWSQFPPSFGENSLFYDYSNASNPTEPVNISHARCEGTVKDGQFLSTHADDSWVHHWLQERKIVPSNPPSVKEITLNDAQRQLKQCALLLRQLKELRKEMHQGHDETSCEEWDVKWAEAQQKRSEVSLILKQFSESSVLSALKGSLAKRVRKRRRQKNRSVEQRHTMHLLQLRRQHLHKQADAWLASMQRSVENARRDEELRCKADSVLSEVTRRQTEGKRQLALIDALHKLRSARVQAAEARGDKLSPDQQQKGKQFNMILDRLRGLWVRHLEEYAKEEHGLRVMLEASAAQESNLETQRIQRTLNLWEECLFGAVDSVEHLSYPSNVETLLAIRCAWDVFSVPERGVVPLASATPVGWILPTAPSSEEWRKYIQPNSD